MPDAHLESADPAGISPPWWPWVVGVVLSSVLIWLAVALTNRGDVVGAVGERQPREQVAGVRQEAGRPGREVALPLAAITRQPESYHGREVSGTAEVAEPAGGRAFWIGAGSTRVLVVPEEGGARIDAGQQVRITGTVRNGADDEQLVEAADPEARAAAARQAAFILARTVEPVPPTSDAAP